MDRIITVLILGLSVEGLVICPFFAFGLTLSDRIAGLNFLFGRLIGVTSFGVIVSLLGSSIHIDNRVTNLIFGGVIIALGLYRIINANIDIGGMIKAGAGDKPVRGSSCGGRGMAGGGEGSASGKCGGRGQAGRKFGFGLGLFRGLLVPGRKYVYLVPLLLGVGVVKGSAISFVYGVSSSVYLVIGFLSAGLASTLIHRKKLIGKAGGIILIILGAVYTWKARGVIF